MNKIICLLMLVTLVLFSGCDFREIVKITVKNNPVEFICWDCIVCEEEDKDYFEDILIITTKKWGQLDIEKSVEYLYPGDNHPYLYEKCMLLNNGYRFEPREIRLV